jgi:hypothetical protein
VNENVPPSRRSEAERIKRAYCCSTNAKTIHGSAEAWLGNEKNPLKEFLKSSQEGEKDRAPWPLKKNIPLRTLYIAAEIASCLAGEAKEAVRRLILKEKHCF